MNDEKSKSAQDADDFEDLAAFFKKNGLILAGSLIVVLIASAAVVLYNTNRTKETAQISKSLFSARSVQDFENVASQHPDSPYAPIAELKIAKSLYDEGNYDAALIKYTDFIAKHPNHEFAPAAELNKNFCFEARGQMQEALAGYESFAKKYPDYFMTPHAIFGVARCKAAAGEIKAALDIYEDFKLNNPKSPWANRAEYLAEDLSTRTGIDKQPRGKSAAPKAVKDSKAAAPEAPAAKSAVKE